MSFTDKSFIYLIAATVVAWLALRRNYRATIGLFLVSSLVFYGHNRWWLIGLILSYCIVDWLVGLGIERARRRRLMLTAGVAFNLGVLCFYKYTPLALHSLGAVCGWMDWSNPPVPPPPDAWYIPFGISFYAFTGIAYMVDVYRRHVPAERNPFTFAAYITLFPQLVAGPILRAPELLHRMQPETLPRRAEAKLEACLLIARGYFKKTVLADRIAIATDPFFTHVDAGATAGVWSLPYVYLYALQIYFDFSAYTDIARGLGLWFGFRWPDNFNLPYLAANVQQFWRRWHITLSTFLRDYLYIPLGGARRGRVRGGVNLMVTMLLGGLWHGATWSFMVWGGLHGVYLILHRLWRATPPAKWLDGAPRGVRIVWFGASVFITFHCVCLAWCFFRLTQWEQSVACVRKWFAFDAARAWSGGVDDASLWALIGAYGLGSMLVWLAAGRRRLTTACEALRGQPLRLGMAWGLAVGLFILALLLSPGGEKPPFIYFQF